MNDILTVVFGVCISARMQPFVVRSIECLAELVPSANEVAASVDVLC